MNFNSVINCKRFKSVSEGLNGRLFSVKKGKLSSFEKDKGE